VHPWCERSIAIGTSITSIAGHSFDHLFTDYQPTFIELKAPAQRPCIYEQASATVASRSLATLRIKTEEQLVQLINHELHLGIGDAREALKSVDTWTVAKECHRRANWRCALRP
jgi:hypothetical protein